MVLVLVPVGYGVCLPDQQYRDPDYYYDCFCHNLKLSHLAPYFVLPFYCFFCQTALTTNFYWFVLLPDLVGFLVTDVMLVLIIHILYML